MQINIEYDCHAAGHALWLKIFAGQINWPASLLAREGCYYLCFLKSHRNCARSQSAAVRLFMALRLQKYERDYTERYFESISSANETTKNCMRKGAKEREEKEEEPCNVLVSSLTRKKHSVRNGLYLRKVK